MTVSRALKRIKPFRRRVEDALKVLSKDGFRLLEGSDSGWFGDGVYILTNDRELLRITRSRKEEFLDIAFNCKAIDRDWFGVAELMVAIGDITFDDAVSGCAVPHDLDLKLQSYLRIRPLVDAKLGPNPEVHEKLAQVRQRSSNYSRQKYGRGPRS